MSGTLIAKIKASDDCQEVRIWKMADGRILLCQGRDGHTSEQVIDLTPEQVEALKAALPVNNPNNHNK